MMIGKLGSSEEGLAGVQWAVEGVYDAGGGEVESVVEMILHWQWVRVGAERACDVKRTRVVKRVLDSMLGGLLKW